MAVYLLSAPGHLEGKDQEFLYRMARAWLLERSFAVEPFGPPDELPGRYGRDGRFYTQYGPGLPLALAPLVGLGRVLVRPVDALRPYSRWPSDGRADQAARFLVSYFNGPVIAATAALLALLVLRLDYPVDAAIFTGLAFGLATFAWPHTRMLFVEPLQGLLILLGGLLLWRATPRRVLLAGLALALGLLVKLTTVLVLPAGLFWLSRRGRPLGRSPLLLALLGAPLVGAALAYGLYNAVRFGSPLATGYSAGAGSGLVLADNPLMALYGLVLSPGRGAVWFAPPLLGAAWALRRFWRRQRAVALVLTTLVAVWLPAHALYSQWDSGWGWGPRYVLPLLPLLLVPLAECWLSRRARLAALGLAALGLAVQLPGASVDFAERGGLVAADYDQHCRVCSLDDRRIWWYFDPAHSDIIGQTALLLAGRVDLGWVSFRATWLAPFTFGTAGMLAAGGWLAIWQGRRRFAAALSAADVRGGPGRSALANGPELIETKDERRFAAGEGD
jgi:hypothetical protein